MTSAHLSQHSTWSTRPYFAPRQLLTARQLNTGLEDELRRQRLLNRTVLGHGVVLGLGLEVDEAGVLRLDDGCLTLTGGLALDRYGRMLRWGGGRIGVRDLAGEPPDCAGTYTLLMHYAERCPRDDDCALGPSETSMWHEQGVAFTLQRGCDQVDRRCPTPPDHRCVDHEHVLCRRTGARSGGTPGDLPASEDVRWALAEPDPPRRLLGRDGWVFDPDPEVAVPLACVEICDLTAGAGQVDAGHVPDCDPRYGFCAAEPEVCRARRYVYRNPLLYELTRCCEVEPARVREVSWQPWVERGWAARVPWPEFERRITSRGADDDGFTVWFTRPVQVSTLHPGSVFLTAVIVENLADYRVERRVPLREVRPLRPDGELAEGVRLVPSDDWLAAEVTGWNSSLYRGAWFEVTIRGQLVRDDCERMLDARPPDAGGECQARPGGDFVSVFQVAPRPRRRDDRDDDEGGADEVAEEG